MNKKIFLVELISGILGVIFIMLFGVKGIAIIALYAISIFLKEKREISMEEKLLFYKTNSITFVFVLLLLFLLFFIQDYQLFTNSSFFVKDIWIYLAITFTLFAHGVIGLIMITSKKQ